MGRQPHVEVPGSHRAAQHGEPFGLLLRRAVGLTLTVKVVTAQDPTFLICSLWVPK